MRYDELLSQLKETLEFCASLGLEEAVKASRFTKYQELILRLCEIIQTYPRERLPQEIAEELTNENLGYVLSLTESLEFVVAVSFLKQCELEVIRRKIATVLRGPVLPNDEDENSNEARNTLFELNFASKLRKAGLNASPGMNADIECTIGGKHLVIECKRHFREHKTNQESSKTTVITASLDRKNDRYSLGEQFNAHPLAPEGSADYATFKGFCDALARLQHQSSLVATNSCAHGGKEKASGENT